MNRIKDLREDMDLKQKDVAKVVKIDQRTLSNYETGNTYPDSRAIVKLAEFFNVSTDYLLGVSDNNFRNAADIAAKLDSIQKELDDIKKYITQSSR